jgi:hypothetical protein
MVDLANISRDDAVKAGNCKLRFLMNSKFYNRFMQVDWKSVGFDDYELYKSIIDKSISDGYVSLESYEPTQYWLDNVQPRVTELSDHLCVVLNWSNFKKAKYVNLIVDICIKLHNYTGKDIDIKLHSFCKESFLKYLSKYDFIHVIPYLDSFKYDIMDKYDTYFVDGTGFGYECSYRNLIRNRRVNIFYFNGLPAESNEFKGIIEMNSIPTHNVDEFLSGVDSSNFDSKIIEESFPFRGKDASVETYKIIHRNCEDIKNLFN